ncbi:unnamed protein product [Leuciscus chuanchicus]
MARFEVALHVLINYPTLWTPEVSELYTPPCQSQQHFPFLPILNFMLRPEVVSQMDYLGQAQWTSLVGVQDEALRFCKRRACLDKLTALRASNPAVPMVSTLDLEQHQLLEEDLSNPQDPEELEEEECDKPGCKRQKELLRAQVADLNRQVDTLSKTVRMVTRRNRILKRRSTSLGSARIGQVAQRLLSSLGPEEEECAPVEEDVKSSPEVPSATQQPPALPDTGEEKPDNDGEKPSTSQQLQDDEAVLNEIVEQYRRHREGPDPGTKLKENLVCKVYRIKKFLAVMSRGKKNLADFLFLKDNFSPVVGSA